MLHRHVVPALLGLALLAAGCDREPDLVAAHLGAGDKALAEGQYADALIAYKHAHEIAPHDPRAQRGAMRARVGLMAEAPTRVGAEVVDDVRYEAQLLLAHDKGREALCLTAIANALARKGDVEGAKVKLAEALKSDPTSPQAHAARGLLLMGSKEGRAEARVELELALKARPNSAAVLAGLGQLKLAEGDLAAAVEKLEAALRQGDDFATRLALGTARLQQQRPVEAAEQLRRAVDLDPKSADAASLLGQALVGAGRFDEGERALRAAVQLRSDEATQTALGFALLRQKKAEQALVVFRQLLAQDAGLASARYGAATANEELGRAEEALADFRKLLASPADARNKALVDDLRPDVERRAAALAAALAPSPDGGAPDAAAPRPSPKRP